METAPAMCQGRSGAVYRARDLLMSLPIKAESDSPGASMALSLAKVEGGKVMDTRTAFMASGLVGMGMVLVLLDVESLANFTKHLGQSCRVASMGVIHGVGVDSHVGVNVFFNTVCVVHSLCDVGHEIVHGVVFGVDGVCCHVVASYGLRPRCQGRVVNYAKPAQ